MFHSPRSDRLPVPGTLPDNCTPLLRQSLLLLHPSPRRLPHKPHTFCRALGSGFMLSGGVCSLRPTGLFTNSSCSTQVHCHLCSSLNSQHCSHHPSALPSPRLCPNFVPGGGLSLCADLPPKACPEHTLADAVPRAVAFCFVLSYFLKITGIPLHSSTSH